MSAPWTTRFDCSLTVCRSTTIYLSTPFQQRTRQLLCNADILWRIYHYQNMIIRPNMTATIPTDMNGQVFQVVLVNRRRAFNARNAITV